MNGFNATLDQGGIGGGRESSSVAAQIAVSTTYAELKALRDAGNLTPGAWYRITDYQTMTSDLKTDVRSADHQFDIIVLALDGSHLSEEAYAAHHEGDTYFADCRLEAWKLKYCLDNSNQYDWRLKAHAAGIVISGVLYESQDESVEISGTTYYKFGTEAQVSGMNGNDNNVCLLCTKATPSENDSVALLYGTDDVASDQYSVESVVEASEAEGKGVVYYMCDEWNNEAPYDFKNIQFYLEIEGQGESEQPGEMGSRGGAKGGGKEEEPQTVNRWLYTFTWINEDNEVQDASIVCQTMTDGEGNCVGITNNKISECNVLMTHAYSPSTPVLTLPFNVFINRYEEADGNFCYGVYSNKIGFNSGHILCGSNVYGVTIGSNSGNIEIGSNTFNVTIGSSVRGVEIGSDCGPINIGSRSGNIEIGSNVGFVTIGSYVENVTIGSNCWNMTIGSGSYNVEIGSGSGNIEIGSGSGDIEIGSDVHDVEIGSSVSSVTIGSNCYYFTVSNGVNACQVTTGTVQNPIKNCMILSGVYSNNGKAEIAFTANLNRTQVATLDASGNVVVYIPGAAS